MKSSKLILGLCAALVAASAFAQATVTVYSQNLAPGDLFQNTQSGLTGASFGHPNWVYNNVRGNDFSGTLGSVGIRNNYPRSGNGSVYFKTVSSGGKADIEYFAAPTRTGTGPFYSDGFRPLGRLSELTHLSYEWYRDGSSNVNAHLHPVLRLLIIVEDAQGNLPAAGYLVFERAYNQGVVPVPTNSWVSDDIIQSNYKLWATPGLRTALGYAATDFPTLTIAGWLQRASDSNYTLHVLAVNAGVGSGWGTPFAGTFEGAVDNITFGFNGAYTTYNFEVVPEPASMLALASGLIGLLGLRRRKR